MFFSEGAVLGASNLVPFWVGSLLGFWGCVSRCWLIPLFLHSGLVCQSLNNQKSPHNKLFIAPSLSPSLLYPPVFNLFWRRKQKRKEHLRDGKVKQKYQKEKKKTTEENIISHTRDETTGGGPESTIKDKRMKWGWEAEKGPKGTGFHVSDKCNHKSPVLPVNNHLNRPIAADATGWNLPKRRRVRRGEEEETRDLRGESSRQNKTKKIYFLPHWLT